MSNNEENLRQVLQDMAKLTVLSGRISDLQEKNLKMFPLVFFEGVSEVKIDYDLSHIKTDEDKPATSRSVVSYYLKINENVGNNRLELRFQHLENSVRNLFWKDVTVEVYFNDRNVYKSAKNV